MWSPQALKRLILHLLLYPTGQFTPAQLLACRASRHKPGCQRTPPSPLLPATSKQSPCTSAAVKPTSSPPGLIPYLSSNHPHLFVQIKAKFSVLASCSVLPLPSILPTAARVFPNTLSDGGPQDPTPTPQRVSGSSPCSPLQLCPHLLPAALALCPALASLGLHSSLLASALCGLSAPKCPLSFWLTLLLPFRTHLCILSWARSPQSCPSPHPALFPRQHSSLDHSLFRDCW